jgi:hypothetical protein
MPRPALAVALSSALLAAVAVAHQRVGLGLTAALLLAIGAGVLGAGRRPARDLTLLAAALALQPVLRDAGWVVAVDVAAAVIAAGAAVGRLDGWTRVAAVLGTVVNLVDGIVLVARSIAGNVPRSAPRRVAPVARGLALAGVLVGVFGALFVTADQAFADVLTQTANFRVDAPQLASRALLAIAFAAAAAAISRVGAPSREPGALRVVGRTEMVIALAALVGLYATFVAVQLRVLFGGAAYVKATTGLGYGEYARQGFVQLLIVAGLTLAVIGVAARRRDRLVTGVLGVMCALTLVVLWSAHHRLGLVEDAYGFTRVRYAGQAVVAWFAGVFVLLMVAGCSRRFVRHLPRVTTTLTLASVLAFSLSNPDARIAQRAVARAAGGGAIDTDYLAGLSADALPVLKRLPARERALVVPQLEARLARHDGLAGLNIARAHAR